MCSLVSFQKAELRRQKQLNSIQQCPFVMFMKSS